MNDLTPADVERLCESVEAIKSLLLFIHIGVWLLVGFAIVRLFSSKH